MKRRNDQAAVAAALAGAMLLAGCGKAGAQKAAATAQTGETASQQEVAEVAQTTETDADAPIDIKVLILPKFEIGEMSGDDAGEAQFYYDAYVKGGEEYEIDGGFEDNRLYVKDGVALYVTGMGKVNAAVSVQAVLSDDRFDWTDTYILSTGCAGSAIEYGTMGDVYVITATADYDLGHHADVRDQAAVSDTTWYHDADYDSSSYRILNQDLCNRVYEMVKDVALETTENTRAFMASTFDNADWAVRDPQVLKGTVLSGDNYWKGQYDHDNAVLIAQTYDCPDPYAVCEMEDNAIAVALDRYGMLDRYIVIRDSVNTDVYMNGDTPESLWDPDYVVPEEVSEEGNQSERADIFATAMENNYKVGRVIIDAILDGTF